MDAWEGQVALDLTEALESLEAQWRVQEAPILDALQPGLTRHAIEAHFATLGLTAPLECLILWGWHDGALGQSVGPGSFRFRSLADTSAICVEERERWGNSTAPDELPDLYWHGSWMPLFTEESRRLFVDADRIDQNGASPVRLADFHWSNYHLDRALSVAQVIRMWAWVIEQRYCWIERRGTQREWVTDWDAIPLFIRRSGLV